MILKIIILIITGSANIYAIINSIRLNRVIKEHKNNEIKNKVTILYTKSFEDDFTYLLKDNNITNFPKSFVHSVIKKEQRKPINKKQTKIGIEGNEIFEREYGVTLSCTR